MRDSGALSIVGLPDDAFEQPVESFAEYDDQTIRFTDHVVSAHEFSREATIYTFDSGDFTVLGNDVIHRRSAWSTLAGVVPAATATSRNSCGGSSFRIRRSRYRSQLTAGIEPPGPIVEAWSALPPGRFDIDRGDS